MRSELLRIWKCSVFKLVDRRARPELRGVNTCAKLNCDDVRWALGPPFAYASDLLLKKKRGQSY